MEKEKSKDILLQEEGDKWSKLLMNDNNNYQDNKKSEDKVTNSVIKKRLGMSHLNINFNSLF